MHYTIYKTINIINGKFYIGKHQTNNLDDGYMGSGKRIKRAIQKYGIENFQKEILHDFETEEEMNAKEKELVTEEFCRRENTYNICEGGKGGFGYINANGLGISENQKRAASKICYKNHLIVNTPEFKAKKLKALQYANEKKRAMYPEGTFKNRFHTAESKLKMSNSHKNKGCAENNSQFGTMWITNGTINKKIKKLDIIPEGWYKGRRI